MQNRPRNSELTLCNGICEAEERLGAAKRREDTARQRAEADAQLLQQRLLSAEEKASAPAP